MIPPGATDNEHQDSRRYGGSQPGGVTKDSHFRATGLVLRPLPFGGGNDFIKEKRQLKESGSIVNMARRRVAKMVLVRIYYGGRHSERILLIFLRINVFLSQEQVIHHILTN